MISEASCRMISRTEPSAGAAKRREIEDGRSFMVAVAFVVDLASRMHSRPGRGGVTFLLWSLRESARRKVKEDRRRRAGGGAKWRNPNVISAIVRVVKSGWLDGLGTPPGTLSHKAVSDQYGYYLVTTQTWAWNLCIKYGSPSRLFLDVCDLSFFFVLSPTRQLDFIRSGRNDSLKERGRAI